MIVWKDEGERSIAYLGQAIVGYVSKRHWVYTKPSLSLYDFPYEWQALDRGQNVAGNFEFAKQEVERAVAEWVARAGLVSADRKKDGAWPNMTI